MDSYEATRIVLSRIQNLDPENASKIIGLLLLQDNGEKEMIRLAFGPEALVHSVILKARKELGLGLQNNSPPTPSSPSPASFLSNPQPIPKHSNSSFSSKTASWGTAFSDYPNTDELISPSSTLNPSSMPFYGNGSAGSDMIDELQLQDQLSFLMDNNSNSSQDMFYPRTELSSSPGGTDLGFPPYWGGHKRSCDVNDVFGSSDLINDPNSGLGWRPCMYFARGYCKNGASCRFVHGGLGDTVDIGVDGVGSGIGSPGKIEMMEQYPEFLRSKSAHHQQQKLAAASQFMASAGSFPYSPKCMNLLLQQQNDSQRAAAALMMGEDMYKLGRSRLERNCFSAINGDLNPASRQIYLTFPADSTFREEDVSNYFSIYGPVQDVRIPYQQKRMFGFVTFVYPETVKIILAKGNPHFVCDARVLVKPYKEKGKVPDKYRKQQQHMERGEFSPCGTPTGIDSRDPFDLQLGARMFYGNNTQDLWRRKLEEQADLQQALDLQSRRLMGLQLLDVKKQHHRALSTGSPIPSPTQSPSFFNQSVVLPQFHSTQELIQENGSGGPLSARRSASPEKKPANVSNNAMSEVVENSRGKESPQTKSVTLLESLEHNLPDSPFASPKKSGGEYLAFAIARESFKDQPVSTTSSTNSNVVSSSSHPANNALDMASFKPFNCQIPSFSSGHGAIGMYKGTGGPTCPVGI